MKPSFRFSKKTWKKPPKKDAKAIKMQKKTGYGRCSFCKAPITSSKKQLYRKHFHPAKSTIRTNRPFGGHLCNNCLRAQIINKTQELSS